MERKLEPVTHYFAFTIGYFLCSGVKTVVTTVGLSLEDLYGICADDPINIDDGGISEALDEDLVGAFE